MALFSNVGQFLFGSEVNNVQLSGPKINQILCALRFINIGCHLEVGGVFHKESSSGQEEQGECCVQGQEDDKEKL